MIGAAAAGSATMNFTARRRAAMTPRRKAGFSFALRAVVSPSTFAIGGKMSLAAKIARYLPALCV
jgi:hypothetical protein